MPSTEAIQAVQSLKLAKSASKMEDVINSKLSRLLKADLFDALTELQRQNELELSLQVLLNYCLSSEDTVKSRCLILKVMKML